MDFLSLRRHAGLTLLVGVSGIVCLLVLSRSTDLPTPVRPGPGAPLPATFPPLGFQDLHTTQDTAPRETVDTISTQDNYLEYGPLHPWLFFHNTQLWTYCKAFPDLCWQPDFLEPFCKLFPFQSVKTVRLRLNLTQELLEDKKLRVQVLLLVRDPRGTMQSRNHRNWCPGNADCDDPAKLCEDLVTDYNTARIFTRNFPHSFKVIRYEDFSFQAHNMTKDLFDFFHLDYHPRVQVFLDTHTKKKVGGVSSTFRNSKTAPVHWQQDLTWEEVVSIQKVCDKALKLWGYKIARYEKHLRSFNPVGKFRK